MAMKLIVTISKKIPGPQDYSSTQSSVSIEGELAVGQDPVIEAARLQAQAVQAVDQFLGLAPQAQTVIAPPQPANTHASSHAAAPGARPEVTTASRPYRTGNQRRSAITPAQMRFLQTLINDTNTSLSAILAHHEIGGLDQLSAAAASSLIDELRARAVRA